MRRFWAFMQPEADAGSGGAGPDAGAGAAGAGATAPGGDTAGTAAATAAAAVAAAQPEGTGITLTAAQRQAIMEGKNLHLTDGQYGEGARNEISTLRKQRRDLETQIAAMTGQRETEARAKLEEQEKWKEIATAEQAKREKLEADHKTGTIRSAFQLAAVQRGVVDAHAAFLLAKELPGFAALAIRDDGAVDGVTELVDVLLEAKPYLKSSTQPTTVGSASSPASAGAGPEPPPKTEAEAQAQFKAAVARGDLSK